MPLPVEFVFGCLWNLFLGMNTLNQKYQRSVCDVLRPSPNRKIQKNNETSTVCLVFQFLQAVSIHLDHVVHQSSQRRRLGLALVLVEVMARPRSVTRYHMGWCCSGKIWEDGSGWKWIIVDRWICFGRCKNMLRMNRQRSKRKI